MGRTDFEPRPPRYARDLSNHQTGAPQAPNSLVIFSLSLIFFEKLIGGGFVTSVGKCLIKKLSIKGRNQEGNIFGSLFFNSAVNFNEPQPTKMRNERLKATAKVEKERKLK